MSDREILERLTKAAESMVDLYQSRPKVSAEAMFPLVFRELRNAVSCARDQMGDTDPATTPQLLDVVKSRIKPGTRLRECYTIHDEPLKYREVQEVGSVGFSWRGGGIDSFTSWPTPDRVFSLHGVVTFFDDSGTPFLSFQIVGQRKSLGQQVVEEAIEEQDKKFLESLEAGKESYCNLVDAASVAVARPAVELLERLVHWADEMGGWEGKVWDEAKKFLEGQQETWTADKSGWRYAGLSRIKVGAPDEQDKLRGVDEDQTRCDPEDLPKWFVIRRKADGKFFAFGDFEWHDPITGSDQIFAEDEIPLRVDDRIEFLHVYSSHHKPPLYEVTDSIRHQDRLAEDAKKILERRPYAVVTYQQIVNTEVSTNRVWAPDKDAAIKAVEDGVPEGSGIRVEDTVSRGYPWDSFCQRTRRYVEEGDHEDDLPGLIDRGDEFITAQDYAEDEIEDAALANDTAAWILAPGKYSVFVLRGDGRWDQPTYRIEYAMTYVRFIENVVRAEACEAAFRIEPDEECDDERALRFDFH